MVLVLYISKDSINETDPQRIRTKAKLDKKIAADAEIQKRFNKKRQSKFQSSDQSRK